MDVNALHSCFSSTLSPDPNERTQAELQLRQAEKSSGFIGGCLDIVLEPQVDMGVKHASGLYMKNKVVRYWNPFEKESPLKIDDAEKPAFRQKIVPALVKVDARIRPAVVGTLNAIVSKDFPSNWPEFLDLTLELFQQNDPESIRAGLTCMLEIVRFYRWTSGELRQGLDRVIDTAFPGVLNLGNQLLNESSPQAGEMMRDVVKIYKMAAYHILPMRLRERENLVGWGTLFLQVIKKPLPQDVLDMEPEEREKHSWVKAKKWSYANLYRLLFRYAQAEALTEPSNEYHQFATMFVNEFVPDILTVFFEQVTQWVNNEIWIGGACLYNMLSFFDRCVVCKATWTPIKPHIETMVSHVIFPLLCPTENDLEMFEDDPEEYIRRRIDCFEETSTADIAASNFLVTLVRKKRKVVFTPMLQFIQSVLDKQLQDPENLDLCRQKEGVLRMMSTIYFVVLNKSSPIKDKMEGFMAQYVFPDFSSKHNFLRARACEFLNRYASIKFHDIQNVSFCYQSVMKCLHDEYLPVQIEAALALQPLVGHESVRAALSDRIPEVMQHFLDLSKRVDVDAINGVMEEFVELFAEQLTPFACELAEQLKEQFMKMVHELIEKQTVPIDEMDFDDLADEDKTMAASGILTTLSSLLLALDNAPELVRRLEEILLPVFVVILEKDMSEFYTEVFGLIENCTFCQKKISNNMWHVFTLMYKAFDGLGLDYLEEMMPCLDEFVMYGQEDIANDQSGERLRMMYDIIATVMKDNERQGSTERTLVAALAQKLLISLRGHMDNYVPALLDLTLQRLAGDGLKLKVVAYHVTLLEVVVAALYYNANATIQFLESKNYTQEFFGTWFKEMNHFTRVQDKKLAALGIMSVLVLPMDQIPQSLQSNLPQLSKGLVNIMGSLPQAIQTREEMSKAFMANDYSSFEQDDLSEWVDDDEDDDEEDSTKQEKAEGKAAQEYLDFLTESANKLEGGGTLHHDEDDEELEEEPLLETPLDHMNTYIAFRDTFQKIQSDDPQRYQLLSSEFGSDEMSIVEATFELSSQPT